MLYDICQAAISTASRKAYYWDSTNYKHMYYICAEHHRHTNLFAPRWVDEIRLFIF